MEWYFVAFIFLLSCLVLAWLSSRVMKSLTNIGKFLGLKEFVIAFFIMALAASLPNLFVDLNASLQHKPEIAFGDIIGGNLVDLTIVLAIAAFFSKKGLSAKSDMVQKSAIFTAGIAVLPLLLMWDGKLDRMDGIILIFAFFLYSWWLFSEKSRFHKIYRQNDSAITFKSFVGNILEILLLLLLLLGASQAVVWSAQFFADKLNVSLSLVGILIVALGNSFPETYFSIISARKNENWMVLGDLMGSVINCSTLVLGLIALIAPFEIKDLSLFIAARTFLIIAAAFSLLFIITGKKISKKEALFLLFIYISFLLVEVFIKPR